MEQPSPVISTILSLDTSADASSINQMFKNMKYYRELTSGTFSVIADTLDTYELISALRTASFLQLPTQEIIEQILWTSWDLPIEDSIWIETVHENKPPTYTINPKCDSIFDIELKNLIGPSPYLPGKIRNHKYPYGSVAKLIEYGGSVYMFKWYKRTEIIQQDERNVRAKPIANASANGDLLLVETLLNDGFGTNFMCSYNAARNGYWEIFELLVSHNCPVDSECLIYLALADKWDMIQVISKKYDIYTSRIVEYACDTNNSSMLAKSIELKFRVSDHNICSVIDNGNYEMFKQFTPYYTYSSSEINRYIIKNAARSGNYTFLEIIIEQMDLPDGSYLFANPESYSEIPVFVWLIERGLRPEKEILEYIIKKSYEPNYLDRILAVNGFRDYPTLVGDIGIESRNIQLIKWAIENSCINQSDVKWIESIVDDTSDFIDLIYKFNHKSDSD